MRQQIKKLIETLVACANSVIDELGSGWKEEIYQKAMEVALRECRITYETQRIPPITFSNHVIGESIPDLVVWLKDKKRKTAIVIDLKADYGVKADHGAQVKRYIKELKKQLRPDEDVYPFGFVINFAKGSNHNLAQDSYEDLGDIQILKVKA